MFSRGNVFFFAFPRRKTGEQPFRLFVNPLQPGQKNFVPLRDFSSWGQCRSDFLKFSRKESFGKAK